MKSVFRFMFILIGLWIYPTAQAAQPSVDWEVEQRFRNFDFLRSPQGPLLAWENLRPKATDESLVNWVSRLNKEGRQSPYATDTGAWNEQEKDAGLVFKKQLLEPPERIDIVAKLAKPVIQQESCKWFVDEKNPVVTDCSDSVRLNIPFSGVNLTVYANGSLIGTESVKPVFKRVLGLGDSYGSGQGNPDKPARWNSGLSNYDVWIPGKADDVDQKFVEESANWLSNRCNRSFWSHQHMVAMKMAAENRHAQIAFVHLACSGAEIVDGLLAKQQMPSGIPAKCLRDKTEEGKMSSDPDCQVPYSQLAAAVSVLCNGTPEKLDDDTKAHILSKFHPQKKELPIRHGLRQLDWVNDLVACDAGGIRPVDTVLLSIGGNDVGFAGVVAHALMPVYGKSLGKISELLVDLTRKEAGVVCPYVGAAGDCPKEKLAAEDRIRELPRRYAALNEAMRTLLRVEGGEIVLTEYPNPLYFALSGLCHNPLGTNDNEWSALRLRLPGGLAPHKWQFNLTYGEANSVDKVVVPKLNNVMKKAANDGGWRFVSAKDVMSKHGWCLGDPKPPIKPRFAYKWDAYADSGRRIRTANDSMLTQWAVKENRIDWLSGTFHPNAYGHAAMADSVMKTLNP